MISTKIICVFCKKLLNFDVVIGAFPFREHDEAACLNCKPNVIFNFNQDSAYDPKDCMKMKSLYFTAALNDKKFRVECNLISLKTIIYQIPVFKNNVPIDYVGRIPIVSSYYDNFPPWQEFKIFESPLNNFSINPSNSNKKLSMLENFQ